MGNSAAFSCSDNARILTRRVSRTVVAKFHSTADRITDTGVNHVVSGILLHALEKRIAVGDKRAEHALVVKALRSEIDSVRAASGRDCGADFQFPGPVGNVVALVGGVVRKVELGACAVAGTHRNRKRRAIRRIERRHRRHPCETRERTESANGCRRDHKRVIRHRAARERAAVTRRHELHRSPVVETGDVVRLPLRRYVVEQRSVIAAVEPEVVPSRLNLQPGFVHETPKKEICRGGAERRRPGRSTSLRGKSRPIEHKNLVCERADVHLACLERECFIRVFGTDHLLEIARRRTLVVLYGEAIVTIWCYGSDYGRIAGV